MKILLNLYGESEIALSYPTLVVALNLERDFGPSYVDVGVMLQPFGYCGDVVHKPDARHERPELESL